MNGDKKEDLSKRLRTALDKRNMKQSDLCSKTGISKSTISYYLAGKSLPKADKLYLICNAMGINEAWLMGYDVPMERRTEMIENDKLITEVKEITYKIRDNEEFRKAVIKLNKLNSSQLETIGNFIDGFFGGSQGQ